MHMHVMARPRWRARDGAPAMAPPVMAAHACACAGTRHPKFPRGSALLPPPYREHPLLALRWPQLAPAAHAAPSRTRQERRGQVSGQQRIQGFWHSIGVLLRGMAQELPWTKQQQHAGHDCARAEEQPHAANEHPLVGAPSRVEGGTVQLSTAAQAQAADQADWPLPDGPRVRHDQVESVLQHGYAAPALLRSPMDAVLRVAQTKPSCTRVACHRMDNRITHHRSALLLFAAGNPQGGHHCRAHAKLHATRCNDSHNQEHVHRQGTGA